MFFSIALFICALISNIFLRFVLRSGIKAKLLAIAFNCKSAPEVHGDGSYGHYHDEKHKYHIWFGNPVKY